MKTVAGKSQSCELCGAEFTTRSALSRHRCEAAESSDAPAEPEKKTRQLAKPVFPTSSGKQAPAKSNSSETQAADLGVIGWNNKKLRFGVLTLGALINLTESVQELKEYCELSSDAERLAAKSETSIVDIVIELLKLIHADPQLRNIFIHPGKATQALICNDSGKGKRWDAIQLDSAIETIFDGITELLARTITPHLGITDELPASVETGINCLRLKFGEDKQRYTKRAKPAIVEHLNSLRQETPHAPPAPTPADGKTKLSPFSIPPDLAANALAARAKPAAVAETKKPAISKPKSIKLTVNDVASAVQKIPADANITRETAQTVLQDVIKIVGDPSAANNIDFPSRVCTKLIEIGEEPDEDAQIEGVDTAALDAEYRAIARALAAVKGVW